MSVRFAIAVLLLCFTPLVAHYIGVVPIPDSTLYLGAVSFETAGLIKVYGIIGYLVLVVYLGITGQRSHG